MIDGSTIKKVFVFGCSFSDYMRDITSVYGQLVADKLNAEYIHNGCGVGSNGRIFRVFTNYLRNKIIDKNSLVILQFTEPSRDEVWFNSIDEDDDYSHYNGMESVDKTTDGGGYYRYKWDSYKWYNNKKLSLILKNKTDYCFSYEYYFEKWKNEEYHIIESLKYKEIPFILLNGAYNDDYHDYNTDNRNLNNNIVNYRKIQEIYPTTFDDAENGKTLDYSHLSQEGMNQLAKEILKKIN
jgi:hypothetical protein